LADILCREGGTSSGWTSRIACRSLKPRSSYGRGDELRMTRSARSSRGLTTWLLASSLLWSPVEVLAQRASIGYQSQAWSSDELRRLQGGLLQVHWNNRVELSFDLGRAGWAEQGSTCAGLIFDPSQCVQETLAVSSEAMGVALGFSLVDASVPGGTLMVAPNAGFSLVHLGKKGETTGGANSDSQLFLDLGLAARYMTEPLVWRLVSFFAEVRVSAGEDLNPGVCADCYEPLQGGATRRSVLLGLSIGR
jgi:hypothetical protein